MPRLLSNILHSPTLKWLARVGAIAVGLATISAVPDNKVKFFGVALVTLASLSLLLEPKILNFKYWRLGSPILVSIALLLGGLWVILSPESPLGPQSKDSGNTMPRPSAKPSSSTASKFAIELPNERLPLCNQLIGTGTIRPGQVLLIFDRPANVSLNDGGKDAKYFLNGSATSNSDGKNWSLEDVSVGQPGENIELVAELVSPKLSEFLAGFKYSVPNANGKGASPGPPGTTWLSTILPPGEIVATAFRQRDQTEVPCSS